MNAAGWLLMICSVTFVVVLMIYCFSKVFKAPATAGHMQDPLEVDTHDKGT